MVGSAHEAGLTAATDSAANLFLTLAGRDRAAYDARAGFRTSARYQVIGMNGEVIPGLYCAANRLAD